MVSGCICCQCGEPPGRMECEDYTSENVRNNCLYEEAIGDLDFSKCQRISEQEQRDKCTYWVSSSSGEFDLCQRIDEDKRRGNCYILNAMRLKDPKICSKVDNATNRQWCELFSPSDVKVCAREFEKGSEGFKNCILWMGVAGKDTEVCDLLPRQDIQYCEELVSGYI